MIDAEENVHNASRAENRLESSGNIVTEQNEPAEKPGQIDILQETKEAKSKYL